MNYAELRANLDAVLDRVADNQEGVVVARACRCHYGS